MLAHLLCYVVLSTDKARCLSGSASHSITFSYQPTAFPLIIYFLSAAAGLSVIFIYAGNNIYIYLSICNVGCQYNIYLK